MNDETKLSLGEDIPSFLMPMLEAAREQIEREHGIFSKLHLRATRIARGEASFNLTPDEDFADGEIIHGGVFTILLDTILAYTVWTRLDKFKPIATINLKTDYLSSVTPGTRIICDAICEGIEDDVAYCSGKATCKDTGRLIATAAGTFMVGTKGKSSGSRL